MQSTERLRGAGAAPPLKPAAGAFCSARGTMRNRKCCLISSLLQVIQVQKVEEKLHEICYADVFFLLFLGVRCPGCAALKSLIS